MRRIYKVPTPEPAANQQPAPAVSTNQIIETDPDETNYFFGRPVLSARFLHRTLVPVAAKYLSAALCTVSEHPNDLTAWWNLLLWPRRLVEGIDSRELPRKTRNERLRAQITGETMPPQLDPYESAPKQNANTLW